jgi:hypothetical protein
VYSTARQEIQDKIRSLVEERLSEKMMEHAGEEGEESYRVSMSSVLIPMTRWRGIEATLQLSQSTNAKTVIIGNGKDGPPIILGNRGAPAPPAVSATPDGNDNKERTTAASPAVPLENW